jgi:RiboL-PSP-HEPN
MTKSRKSFDAGIKDAELMLELYKAHPKESPESGEALKRAGLVLALTAWETYIEDLIAERVDAYTQVLHGSPAGAFMKKRLEIELKQFHNPNSAKTQKLFKDFLEIDITEAWHWANYDNKLAKDTLDRYLTMRGDAVHRARVVENGTPSAPHTVKKDELDKAIRFLKGLVEATELRFDR